jgi:hypothetical protein
VLCGNHIRRRLWASVILSLWKYVDYRNATAACYPDAKPESGFIWKPYKQKFRGRRKGGVVWHAVREIGVLTSITFGGTEGTTCQTHESCASRVTRRARLTAIPGRVPLRLTKTRSRGRSGGPAISVNAQVRKDATDSICEPAGAGYASLTWRNPHMRR